MTRGEMKTLVKRYGFDEEDPIDDWINGAMWDLCREHTWPFLEFMDVLTLTSGSQNPFMPADFKSMIFLKIAEDTNTMDQLSIKEFNRLYPMTNNPTVSRPSAFVLSGTDNVLTNFRADKDYDLILAYRVQEPEMDDDADSPTFIPPEMHMAIVYRAAAIGLNAENEEERADKLQGEYNNVVTRAISDIGQTRSPNYVQDTMDYAS